MADGPIVVLVACADDAQAAAIARGAVEARVAACAQALPIRSWYRWEGEVVDDAEVLLMLKSNVSRFAALETVVRQLHDYDVPEILALPVTHGARDYLGWLAEAVTPQGEPPGA